LDKIDRQAKKFKGKIQAKKKGAQALSGAPSRQEED